MSKIRYFDPQSSVISSIPVAEKNTNFSSDQSGSPKNSSNNLLTERQLQAIHEFHDLYPETDIQLLRDYVFLGKTVRELAREENYACHSSTISRKLIQIRKKLRIHVLAASQEFLFKSLQSGFTLCPRTGSLIQDGTCYAVGLQKSEILFEKPPSYLQCRQFLHQVWETICTPYLGATGVFQADHYLGGWIKSEGRYELNLTTLIDDYPTAMNTAIEEGQQHLFNLTTGEPILVSAPVQVA